MDQIMKNHLHRKWLALSVLLMLFGFSGSGPRGETLFQVSTMAALEQGDFRGRLSLQALRRLGDFGIGTFDGLDGEMVELDGRIYQVAVDGIAHPATDSMKTPFAMVSRFKNEKPVLLEKPMSLAELERALDEMLKAKDGIYAIKVEGEFRKARVRSVPKQDSPFPVLAVAVKSQRIFELTDQSGTAVGYWFPAFMSGVNAPGYHFHFLSRDAKSGGHLLDCETKTVKVTINRIEQFHLLLMEPPAK